MDGKTVKTRRTFQDGDSTKLKLSTETREKFDQVVVDAFASMMLADRICFDVAASPLPERLYVRAHQQMDTYLEMLDSEVANAGKS